MDRLDYAVWVGQRRIDLANGETKDPLTPFLLSAEELGRQRRSWMSSSSLMSVRKLVELVEKGRVPDSWISSRLELAGLDPSGERDELVSRLMVHLGLEKAEEPKEMSVDERREQVAALAADLSIDEMAERFGVSARTIQRDIDSMQGEEE